MKPHLAWILVAILLLYLQCKLSVFVVGLLPGFTAVEHSGSAHLPDDFRDSGFSILPVTPYRLPDLHLAVGVLLTIFNRNTASDGKDAKETSMAHHVLYFVFVTLVFCYQYNLFTTYPVVDPSVLISLKAPFHEQSLFAHTNEFHISTHAILMTMLMLCWRFYQPTFQHESKRPLLYIVWFLGVTSIISSRVEFTQDVGRGCFFAFIVFYSYFFVICAENDQKQPALRAVGVADRRNRLGRNAAQIVARPDALRQPPPVVAPIRHEPDGEISRLRELYLRLMQRTLTNTIYMDPPVVVFDPTNRQQFISNARFNLDAREHGLDLPSQAHCRCGARRLQTIRNCIESLISLRTAGDLVNIGVWRGGESAFMKAVLAAFNAKDRHVIGVGNFRGPILISERLQYMLWMLGAMVPGFLFKNVLWVSSLFIPGVKTFPVSAKIEGPDGAWNQFRLKNPDVFLKSTRGTDLYSVRDVFVRYNLFDEKVTLLSGAIPEVLSSLQPRTLALIRIGSGVSDYDMLEGLRHVYPRLASGGFVIIDDYLCSKQAVDSFRAERNCEDALVWVDRQCVYWQKSA